MAVPVNGHRERMRQQAERMNVESMRPQDLIEMLLYYALPRRDTKPQAYALLERFGSLQGVFSATEEDLRAVQGIGPGAARWLKRLSDLTGAYSALESTDRPLINNVQRASRYLRAFFDASDYDEVWQFCVNAGGRLLAVSPVADNAAWAESEYLRSALTCAMGARAHSVVLGRFSPSPDATFEPYDLENTAAYAVTLAAAGIQMLDQLLITPKGVTSLFATGKLDHVRDLIRNNRLRENYLAESDDGY